MITGGFGYNGHYSRTSRETDFLDLQLHLGRMEVDANLYDLCRIGYKPHLTETEIAGIKNDLELVGGLTSRPNRKTYHSTAEVSEEIDRLKARIKEKGAPEEDVLSFFKQRSKPTS